MRTMAGITSADYKVPGGKLLRVSLSADLVTDPPRITQVTLTGDFFMHPEEAIEELESVLVGAPLERAALEERIRTWMRGRVQLIGATPEDFAYVIMLAYTNLTGQTERTS